MAEIQMPEILETYRKFPTEILPVKQISIDDLEEDDYSNDYAVYCHDSEITGVEEDDYREMLEGIWLGSRLQVEQETRFWNMLVAEVPKLNLKITFTQSVQVLDLACGSCDFGQIYEAYFGNKPMHEPSVDVHICGVDIDEEEIKGAVYNNSRFQKDIGKYGEMVLPPNYRFIVGDAADLTTLNEVPAAADIAFVRNQQAFANGDSTENLLPTWKNIFAQALKNVSNDGVVIISSYSEMEHKQLLDLLKELPCIVVDEFRNEAAMALDYASRFGSFERAKEALENEAEEGYQETDQIAHNPAYDKYVVVIRKQSGPN